jgi:hypothetical protein
MSRRRTAISFRTSAPKVTAAASIASSASLTSTRPTHRALAAA